MLVVNNVSFNHDSLCVVLATEKGFRILKTDSGALLHTFDTVGPMRICEMLRDTRLIVCVGDGGGLETPDLSPRRLKILNVDWETLIADLAFRTTVRSVKMNRHVLVVCEDEEVTVFEMKGLARVMNVPQRSVNAEGKGVAAINSDAVSASDFNNNTLMSAKSSSSEKGEEKEETNKDGAATNNNSSYLAVVSHLSETTVVIYDLHNVHVATEIPNAHEGPVAMLAFSQKGDILASCSVKGTVVRTWDVPSGEPRNIFRRGSTTAEITSLQFAYSSERFAFEPELLAVASDSGTAHVFQCFESTNKSSSSNFRGEKREGIEEEGEEGEEDKDEKQEIDEEKKVEAIEAKYAASSASTAHKILRLGGLVSKLALTGAKKVTKTSVNALAKVSSTVLHTTGVSTKFTKSFLEPKRAATVIKLPAHKRMAAARNEKFAIGLESGESNLQVDVVNTNEIKAAAVPSPTQSRVEWNVVSIRPPADFNHDAKTIVVGSKSSSQKKDVAVALYMPPSLNPDDEDEDVGDATNEDVKKELTKRVRVVCASSTGILYDYRVRLKSSVQAVNNDDDDDDGENNSPLLETTASSTTTKNNNNNNNKSECALEREIAMLTPGASETTTTTTRFTGFSGWRRPGSSSSNSSFSKKQQQQKQQQQPSTADEEENALKYSMMQASQLRSPSSQS